MRGGTFVGLLVIFIGITLAVTGVRRRTKQLIAELKK
jgi:hypothetical protein